MRFVNPIDRILSGSNSLILGTNLTLASGQLLLPDGTASAPSIAISSESNSGWYKVGSGQIGCAITGSLALGIIRSTGTTQLNGQETALTLTTQGTAAIHLPGGGAVGIGGSDCTLFRDGAADILAQRRGTNAQELRLYGTFTDSSNYERLTFKRVTALGDTSALRILSEAAGTGTLRSLHVDASTSTLKLNADTLYFYTGGSSIRWLVSSTGHLFAGSDNTYDIGQSGSTRPKDVYLAGWVKSYIGRVRVTADVTNATTTFSNLSDLSVTLQAGRKYVGEIVLFALDSTAADGLKFDLNGGTATVTDLEFGISSALGSTAGTTTGTALATALTLTTATTADSVIVISFALTCNAGGTFIPRFAQNAHTAGTATVRKNSSLTIDDSSN